MRRHFLHQDVDGLGEDFLALFRIKGGTFLLQQGVQLGVGKRYSGRNAKTRLHLPCGAIVGYHPGQYEESPEKVFYLAMGKLSSNRVLRVVVNPDYKDTIGSQ